MSNQMCEMQGHVDQILRDLDDPIRHPITAPTGHLNPGKKADEGKSPIFQGCLQYFPRALLAVANVSKYGKLKYNLEYSDVNWARVEDGKNRYTDAMVRHLLGESVDGELDPESKQLHATQVAWNALARLEKILMEKEGK